MLRFEWDDAKNAENMRKHRVAFEEAETVFYDDRGVLKTKALMKSASRSSGSAPACAFWWCATRTGGESK